MSTDRRAFLGLFGRTVAAASVPVIAALPAPVQPLTGPISPADYVDQRMALGDRLYAGLCNGRVSGFIECTGEYRRGSADVRRDLSGRYNVSGADFHRRVAQELARRGLTEDITPRGRRHV